MKNFLLILLCVPLLFSCGEKNTENKENVQKEEKKEENSLDKDGLMEQFNKDLKRSIEASNNKEWDVTLDMTYPKLFDYINKEEMLLMMEGSGELFSSLNIIASEIKFLSPIVNYNEIQYTRYFYDAEINMIFHNIYDFEASLESFIEVVGEDNIRYDENTLLIQINKEMSSLAILQKNSSEWKYLEWKEDLFEQIDIIPDSIIEELKQ
jgi:hypothetical protein